MVSYLAENWPIVVEVAFILLQLFGGGALVYLQQAIRDRVELTPRGNQSLAVIFAAVYALLTLIVEGAITPESFNTENLSVTFLLVLSASQFEYNRLKRKSEETTSE